MRIRYLVFLPLLALLHLTAGAVPYDLRAVSCGLAPTVGLNRAPLTLAITLRNVGTVTVWACDLHYQVNGGPVRTVSHAFPFGEEIMAGGGRQTVAHPVAWVPSAPGTYTIRCWASALNAAHPDGNPANDTLTAQVTVVPRDANRLALLEVFTSGSCPNCGANAPTLEALEGRMTARMACLHYQQDFPGPGDIYRTGETVRRRHYYGVNAIPTVSLDGAAPMGAGFLGAPAVEAAQAIPSFVDLDAVFSRQSASQSISIQARVTALADLPSRHLVAHVVVVEPLVTPSFATNGQAVLPHLVRKLLPTSQGTHLGALALGATRQLSQSWTVPQTVVNCRLSQLTVVVFVQDSVTHEVYQAVRARLNGTLGTADEKQGADLAVVPNPASGAARVELALSQAWEVKVEVFDPIGRRVIELPGRYLEADAHSLPLPVAGLAPGLYVVRVRMGEAVETRRLVVE